MYLECRWNQPLRPTRCDKKACNLSPCVASIFFGSGSKFFFCFKSSFFKSMYFLKVYLLSIWLHLGSLVSVFDFLLKLFDLISLYQLHWSSCSGFNQVYTSLDSNEFTLSWFKYDCFKSVWLFKVCMQTKSHLYFIQT